MFRRFWRSSRWPTAAPPWSELATRASARDGGRENPGRLGPADPTDRGAATSNLIAAAGAKPAPCEEVHMSSVISDARQRVQPGMRRQSLTVGAVTTAVTVAGVLYAVLKSPGADSS